MLPKRKPLSGVIHLHSENFWLHWQTTATCTRIQIHSPFRRRRSTRRSWIRWMGNCNRMRDTLAMQRTDLWAQTWILQSRVVLWILLSPTVLASVHRVLLYHHRHRHTSRISYATANHYSNESKELSLDLGPTRLTA